MASINEIADKIKENASKSGKVVGKIAETSIKKADGVIETVKYKVKILDLDTQIDSLYKSIGMEIYKNHTESNAEFDEESVNLMLEGIDEKRDAIADYVQKIESISGKIKCPKCGFMPKNDMNYCPSCGEPIA